MRVALVGPPADRARLRAQLPAEMTVVGEYLTAVEAAGSGILFDGVLVASPPAPKSRGGPPLSVHRVDASVEHLTPRELEVLGLLADGLPNRAIAARLDISAETVKFHVASIMGKLGTTNRVETVRQAVRNGLIVL